MRLWFGSRREKERLTRGWFRSGREKIRLPPALHGSFLFSGRLPTALHRSYGISGEMVYVLEERCLRQKTAFLKNGRSETLLQGWHLGLGQG